MALWLRPQLAESLHQFLIIPNQNSLHGSVDTPKLIQFSSQKIICCLDQYGEILVPLTSGDGSESWVMKCRGSNRNVEESWHDPDEFTESLEMVSHTNARRPYWKTASTGVTRTSQPNTQLDL